MDWISIQSWNWWKKKRTRRVPFENLLKKNGQSCGIDIEDIFKNKKRDGERSSFIAFYEMTTACRFQIFAVRPLLFRCVSDRLIFWIFLFSNALVLRLLPSGESTRTWQFFKKRKEKRKRNVAGPPRRPIFLCHFYWIWMPKSRYVYCIVLCLHNQ